MCCLSDVVRNWQHVHGSMCRLSESWLALAVDQVVCSVRTNMHIFWNMEACIWNTAQPMPVSRAPYIFPAYCELGRVSNYLPSFKIELSLVCHPSQLYQSSGAANLCFRHDQYTRSLLSVQHTFTPCIGDREASRASPTISINVCMYASGISRTAGKHILDDLLSQVIKPAAQGNANVHKKWVL